MSVSLVVETRVPAGNQRVEKDLLPGEDVNQSQTVKLAMVNKVHHMAVLQLLPSSCISVPEEFHRNKI